MISRLFIRSLNVSSARMARVLDNCRNSGVLIRSSISLIVGVFMNNIPNAGMRAPNALSGGPPTEYWRRRGIAETGISCNTLSREKTCRRSCL